MWKWLLTVFVIFASCRICRAQIRWRYQPPKAPILLFKTDISLHFQRRKEKKVIMPLANITYTDVELPICIVHWISVNIVKTSIGICRTGKKEENFQHWKHANYHRPPHNHRGHCHHHQHFQHLHARFSLPEANFGACLLVKVSALMRHST